MTDAHMAAKPSRRKAKPAKDPADRIVDAALELAEETGWSSLRLSAVAARLEIPVADIHTHFRDKDAVANAVFGRALQAMLAPAPDGFEDLPAVERLFLLLMRWFDALAPHRAIVGDMLQDKLYPSHPHHWVPMIFNLSRTIHWLLDAALTQSTGRRRQLEEIGLSLLFLATLRTWLRDDSMGQTRTRAWLERRLETADRFLARRFDTGESEA